MLTVAAGEVTLAKTVLTDAAGEVTISVPRDRAVIFDPVIVNSGSVV